MDSLLISIKLDLRLLSHCTPFSNRILRIWRSHGRGKRGRGRGKGKEKESTKKNRKLSQPFDLDPWRNFSAAEKTSRSSSTIPPPPSLSRLSLISAVKWSGAVKIFAYRVTGASVFSRFDRSTTNRPPGKKRGDGPEIGRREIQGGRGGEERRTYAIVVENRLEVWSGSKERKGEGSISLSFDHCHSKKTDSKHGSTRIGRLKLGRPFAFRFDVAPGLRLVSTLGQKLRPTRPGPRTGRRIDRSLNRTPSPEIALKKQGGGGGKKRGEKAGREGERLDRMQMTEAQMRGKIRFFWSSRIGSEKGDRFRGDRYYS